MIGNDRKIGRFEIWVVSLDPTIGGEISKSRPCLVISPDEMNNNLKTILVAPITHTIRKYPTRIFINLKNQEGEIALDQMRAVDRVRFIHKIDRLNEILSYSVCEKLKEIFDYG
jgi:mRNA interferase MazF